MELLEKYLSRKFLVALGGILALLGGWLSGEVLAEKALMGIVVIVASYIFGQGYADGKAVQARMTGQPPVQPSTPVPPSPLPPVSS